MIIPVSIVAFGRMQEESNLFLVFCILLFVSVAQIPCFDLIVENFRNIGMLVELR